ncbi:MAG TPA: hypothetical protein VMD03_07820 [Steroidobacteraceae bacterium]|nr:hypothetical protein [Steroidobacteraceae bacterium]
MGSQDQDLSSIQTQLTAARWHLDAAVSAPAEAVPHSLQRARDSYESIVGSLSRLNLTAEQRAHLERELSALRSRLEAAGALPRTNP